MSVLLIDNDSDLCQKLKAFLEEKGLKVQVAGSWSETQKIIANNNFDVYIINFLLSDGKGNEIAEKIYEKKARQDSYFIIKSGMFDENFILNSVSEHLRPVTGFISEPVEPQELWKKIENLDGNKDSITRSAFMRSVDDFRMYALREKNKAFHGHQLIGILFTAYKTNANGALTVHLTNELQHKIYFKNGSVIKISSTGSKSPKNYFGSLLVAHGFVLTDDLEIALKEKSNRKIGYRLVEKGLLSPHAITFILKEQIKIQLNEMLSKDSFRIKDIEDFNVEDDFGEAMEIPYFLESDLLDLTINYTKRGIPFQRSEAFYDKNKNCYLEIDRSPRCNLPEHEAFLEEYNLFTKNFNTKKTLKEILSTYDEDKRKDIFRFIYFGIATESLRIRVNKLKIKDDKAEHILNTILKNESENLFKNFDLPWRASVQEVESRYKKLVPVLHPDSLPANCPTEQKQKYNEAFKILIKSYKILSHPEEREKYLNANSDQKLMDVLLEYNKGLKAINSHDYKKALEILGEIAHNPQAPKKIAIYILWAKIQSQGYNLTNEGKAGKIRQQIDALAPEHKISALYFFINGLYYKYTQKQERAINSFKKAIQIKPDFKEVQKEIVKVRMELKKSDANKKSHFLSNLFGGSKKAS